MALSVTLDRVRKSVSNNSEKVGHPLDRVLARQATFRLEESRKNLTSTSRPSVITRTPTLGNSPDNASSQPPSPPDLTDSSLPLRNLLQSFAGERSPPLLPFHPFVVSFCDILILLHLHILSYSPI